MRGGRSGGCSWRRFARVDHILQFLAGLEKRYFLGRDFNTVPSLRVSPNPGLTLASAETAEAANLDFVAHVQRAHNTVEDGFYNYFAIFTRQLSQTGNFFDQISFCHTPLSLLYGIRIGSSKKQAALCGDQNLVNYA